MPENSIHKAYWISAPQEYEAPVIIRRFSTENCKSAVLNITALGFFKAFINGKAVCEDYFVPAVTDFEPRDTSKFLYPIFDTATHRVYYYSYDISSLLSESENILEIHLANGWYRQKERIAEGDMRFGETLKALYSIDLESEGRSACIFSNGSETLRSSEIVYSNIFVGEIIDPCAVSGEKQEVSLCDAPDSLVCRAQGVPDRIIRTISPKLIAEEGGRKIYDAGENISGIVRIKTNAAAGSKIILRFAEELSSSNALNFESTGAGHKCSSGLPQIMTDTFICDGTPRSFEPSFVWHAFRYFDVEGDIDSAEVLVIHSDTDVTSSFESSSEGLNFLYDAYIRSQLTNMHGSIPSDCPHRERLGYTGDGQACAATGMLLLDSREFYRKWITDILDCQDINGGHVQHTAPFMGGGGGPGGWGCAIVFVPYYFYKHFGEEAMLKKCYEPMRKWVNYLKSRSENGLIVREEKGGWCLGDWCTLEPTVIPEPYVNSCYFIKILKIMCDIADIIGKTEHKSEYISLIKEITDAVKRDYLDNVSGSFCGGLQGADVYAVWCGISGTEAVGAIAQKYDALGHFDTGFLATDLLIETLFENGFEDVALKLLEGEEMGSYLYMKRRGATTLWEQWDGANSHNHPMFGACARHLISGILGIRQCKNSAGFERLIIEPKLPKKLCYAMGSVKLPIGEVSVGFERSESGIHFDIKIPENITAEFEFGDKRLTLSGTQSFNL